MQGAVNRETGAVPFYYSASDDQLVYLHDRHGVSRFDESLVNAVLFGPGVDIPDMFIFANLDIERHVLADTRPSLLEVSIQEGYVRPLFRQDGTRTFTEALEVLKKRDIKHINRPGAELVARELDRAASKSTKFAPRYWSRAKSSKVSLLYKDKLLAALTRPVVSPLLVRDEAQRSRVIDRIESYQDTVKIGVDYTGQFDSDKGLRRSEFWRALGLRVDRPKNEYSRFNDLLNHGDAALDSDVEEKVAFQLVAKASVDAHHLAYAEGLQCSKHLAWYKPGHNLIGDPLTTPTPRLVAADAWKEGAAPIRINVPSLESLLRANARSLLLARKSRERFHEELSGFFEDPISEGPGSPRARLQSEADEIAKGLRAAVKDNQPAKLDIFISREWAPIAAAGLALSALHMSPYPVPQAVDYGFAALYTIQSGRILYRWSRDKSRVSIRPPPHEIGDEGKPK